MATPESPFPDIVSANAGDDSLTTLINLGFQNFALNTTAGCGGDLWWSFYAITSDVLGPGPHHDIAAVQIESDYVMVQRGNGLGGFTQDCNQYGPDIYHLSPPGGAPLRAFRPRDITSGHLNGGVKPDLVATLNAYGGIQDPHPDYVAILTGKGDGTFQHTAASTQYYKAVPAGSTPVKVIIADLTRDGFGDIITSNHESNSISVLVNMMLVISPEQRREGRFVGAALGRTERGADV